MTSAFRILEAESLHEFQLAVPLMREFLAWVRTRYRDTPVIIDSYYDAAAWETELGSLRQLYSRPSGVLLLSINADQPAGCVGMRKIDADICEMKRLYVREQYQKFGVGRNLCEHLLRYAEKNGFHRMRLETGDQQSEAQSLYRSLGFYEIDAYHTHPPELLRRVVCMELALH
jgi:GNAT superfamily N-acetyltransferase